MSVIHCCTISRVKSAAKVLLFSGLTKDFARKREEKCQILKIGNYSGAKRWKIFSPASRELLPTRCGGTAKEKILKKVHIAINIKIYTEFYVRTCSSSLARRIYSPKHTTKCFAERLNRFKELLAKCYREVSKMLARSYPK